jgi:hypothetical protein
MTPKLPAGFELEEDGATPPLPAGFEIEGDAPQASMLGDVAKQLGAGIATGVEAIPTTVPILTGLAGQGAQALLDKFAPGFTDPTKLENQQKLVELAAQARNGGIAQYLPQPQTTAGEAARSVGSFVPSALGLSGGVARNTLGAVGAGLGSFAGEKVAPSEEAKPYFQLGGALLGGTAALKAPSVGSRVVTPLPISAERAAMVDALKKEGVTALTAGQVTGRKGLQWMEGSLSDLPFAGGKAATIADQQGKQLTRAALTRIGADADLASPEVVDRAVGAISKRFEDLSARNTLKADKKFFSDLSAAESEYKGLTVPSLRAPIVEKLFSDLHGMSAMPGEQYQAIRSQLSKQAESLKISNPPLSDAMRNARKALDSAMNRSISAADRGEWAEARRQWGNWKTLAKANISGEGAISPATLKQAARSGNREGYARGRGDFNELARSASEIMKAMPQSGTAPRTYAQNFFPTLLAGAGGGAGLGGLPGALVGAAAVASPPLAGRAIMSKPVQAYLKNQLLAAQQGDPLRLNLARAALYSLPALNGLAPISGPSR